MSKNNTDNGIKEGKIKIRWSVMSVTVILFALMLVAIVVNAEQFYHVLNNLVMNNLMWGVGWVSRWYVSLWLSCAWSSW